MKSQLLQSASKEELMHAIDWMLDNSLIKLPRIEEHIRQCREKRLCREMTRLSEKMQNVSGPAWMMLMEQWQATHAAFRKVREEG